MSHGHLKPGSTVYLKPAAHIAASLDWDGTLEGLPFMPEMLQFCGGSFRVSNIIDKVCVEGAGVRRFSSNDVVALEGLRCNGQSHGGCKTACLLLWKEAWLTHQPPRQGSDRLAGLDALAARLKTHDAPHKLCCQASQLREATVPFGLAGIVVLAARDLAAGRVSLRGLGPMLYSRTIGPCRWLAGKAKQLLLRRKAPVSQPAQKTPVVSLGLQPGDLVRVKTREEIAATLDRNGKNRGLKFTDYMIPFCGGRFRVRARLDKIVLETSGELKDILNTVLLEDVTCSGLTCWGYCPRQQYHFWREAWLEKVDRAEP